MKKITGFILAVAIACMPLTMPVLADNDNVEIAFKIGDSVLQINGSDIEVEKPYVAGEGVTLVPLRVISEAFGAEVGWEGETKTITVDYEDRRIVLQIDNKEAVVNGQADELLEAPQLTENGYTMVPLRFISETFGAEVGWDNDTQAVTVSRKSKSDEQISDKDPEPTTKPGAVTFTAPDAIFTENLPELSENDSKLIEAQYSQMRYSFEQSVLPQTILSDDFKKVNFSDTDGIDYVIYASWISCTDRYVTDTLSQSETDYIFENSDDYYNFLTNVSIQCGHTLKETFENIEHFDDENGDNLIIITMSDPSEALISKYIGIKRDKDGNIQYYTLEKSLDNYYMFCEITANDRGSITSLRPDHDAFVEAVKAGGERIAVTKVN